MALRPAPCHDSEMERRILTRAGARGAAALLGAAALAAVIACSSPRPAEDAAPQSLPMGAAKSRMTFFVTSRGTGRGGDLGGLAGADAHCQALALAEGAGDHTWRAYLSASATGTEPAVNARDRIGRGPWYNANAELVASNLAELHGDNRLNVETALSEKGDPINGVTLTPNTHDILTGSRPDGTAYASADELTCANWTSSNGGRAEVGHHDRMGQDAGETSWNAAHASRGCSPQDLQATGGAGLFYCFAID